EATSTAQSAFALRASADEAAPPTPDPAPPLRGGRGAHAQCAEGRRVSARSGSAGAVPLDQIRRRSSAAVGRAVSARVTGGVRSKIARVVSIDISMEIQVEYRRRDFCARRLRNLAPRVLQPSPPEANKN